MKYIITLIVFLLTISIAPKASAFEKQAGNSAQLISYNKGLNESDKRVLALQNVFKKYNSPLTPYASYYVKYADNYGVDWKLLPSIAGLESYFGRFLVPDTHNAYGWGGGYIYFEDWEDGIETINRSLKKNYIDRGADNVYKIGPIYAEAGHWSSSVSRFMNEINIEYITLSKPQLSTL